MKNSNWIGIGTKHGVEGRVDSGLRLLFKLLSTFPLYHAYPNPELTLLETYMIPCNPWNLLTLGGKLIMPSQTD